MSERGDARRIYEAAQRSGWDSYRRLTVKINANGQRIKYSEGAIAAARYGEVARLVDCLRGRKPLTDADRVSLAVFMTTKLRRRYLPKQLGDALLTKSDADYDTLADFVEQTGRRRGRQRSKPVHDATLLTEALMSLGLIKAAAIKRACEIVGEEAGTSIGDEQVRDLLDRPKKRRRGS